jgi:hypothetical protein
MCWLGCCCLITARNSGFPITHGYGPLGAVQVSRGVDRCGSSWVGVILFLCLMGRSYSGVGGVLVEIFALVLSRFCGPISCNMSFRDVHPSL